MFRKNRIQKAFTEYATSSRGNSVLMLIAISAAQPAFPRTSQLEVLALLTRTKPRVIPAMLHSLIKELQAALTQTTGRFSIRAKVKSR